jgi:hypothetical protein
MRMQIVPTAELFFINSLRGRRVSGLTALRLMSHRESNDPRAVLLAMKYSIANQTRWLAAWRLS